MKTMNKTNKPVRIATILAALIMLLALAGCGSPVPDRLVGEWSGAETASDGSTYTAYLKLTINSDGTFSMVDVEAGNPVISGSMKGDDTGKIGILELKCDTEEFNPPACWAKLNPNSRIRYKFTDSNTVRLRYVGYWITFTK